jgi:hypothetical protein
MALKRLRCHSRDRVPELTVLSYDADATSLPSGENATELTMSKWPLSIYSAAPVTAS